MGEKIKKIGLFGGTFDPIHNGHLIIADAVRETKSLDLVIFIPSAHPPHKGIDLMFNAQQRLKMLSLAIKDDPEFSVSDIEMQRHGPSYTIDTIRDIKTQFPAYSSFSFILPLPFPIIVGAR